MFFKVIYGTAHYKTRFLHFLKTNPNVSKDVIYFVDNDEIYDEFKNDYKIVSIDSLRENHEWSCDHELFFKESDDTKYVKNFWNYYSDKNTLLPTTTLMFPLLYMYEKNILKFTYIPNNFFMVDDASVFDYYFNSIPIGTFTSQLHGWDLNKNRYATKSDGNMISENPLINEYLKNHFPNLILPESEYNLEYYFFQYSFRDREHIKLFYILMDSIVKIIYENKLSHFFKMNTLAYTAVDDIFGYLMRIFEINYDYKIDGYLKYWNTETMGVHHTTYHDNWYYKLPKNIETDLNWHTNDKFGSLIIPKECTIEKYIEKNKTVLPNFLNDLTNCIYEITPNNEIIIKHKNNI